MQEIARVLSNKLSVGSRDKRTTFFFPVDKFVSVMHLPSCASMAFSVAGFFPRLDSTRLTEGKHARASTLPNCLSEQGPDFGHLYKRNHNIFSDKYSPVV